MSQTVPTIVLLIAAVTPSNVVASDSTEDLASARAHWLHGRYEEAVEGYTKLISDEKVGAAAAIGLSRCHEATGKWREANQVVEQAQALHPMDPDLSSRLAELAFEQGQVERADNFCTRALAANLDHLRARWVAARIADAGGDADQARRGFEWFVRFYNAHPVVDPDSLVIIGQAAVEYAARAMRGKEQSEQLGAVLNSMFDTAVAADSDFWPALYQSGRLFLEKYRKGDALKDLRRALAINPNAADVHVALGVAALNDFEIEAGHEHADRALRINPNLPNARRLKADLFLARDQFAEALTELEHARDVNPIDEETLARIAACYLFTRRAGDFDRLDDAVRSRNSHPVTFYSRLAERLEDHRRFDVAEQYFKQAIEAGPDRSGPHTGLGMLYMRVGKEEEAATTLDAAFQSDPFNVRTKNMLEVLDQLKGYKTIDTEHFRVKVDEKLDGLLGRYVAKYLEEIYGELTERFAFHPEGRVQIEIFNKGRGQSAHQWFSARTVGLPWIGTVGACTGKVVAMASPSGLDKPFNWARVLKHEVSHVITLQQTHFQIPHWYTEALAVQAEGYPRPQVWNQLLLERVPAGNLFNLDNINLAFARPRTQLDWQMAYCQSELYAEYMQTRFGSDSTARLLDAYREGQSTGEAIASVFRVPLSDFESSYLDHLKKVTAGLRAGPTEPAMGLAELERAYAADSENADLAARLANALMGRKQYPRARELALKATQATNHHPLGSFVLARLSMVVGDVERARQILEPALNKNNPDPRVLELLADIYTRAGKFDAARDLYEMGRKQYPGESKWVAGAARIALQSQDRAALRVLLVQLSLLDADDPTARKKLASMALEDKDWEQAVRYAWMTLHIDVTDGESHLVLADARAAQEKWFDAADEYRVVCELRPKDRSVPLKLARALRSAGDREAAIEVVRQLLSADPQNEAARELLADLESK